MEKKEVLKITKSTKTWIRQKVNLNLIGVTISMLKI